MKTIDEMIDEVAEAYSGWQIFLQDGCGPDFDATEKQMQAEYQVLRAELLARLSGSTQ